MKRGADIVRDDGEVISNAEMTIPAVSQVFHTLIAVTRPTFPRLSKYVAGCRACFIMRQLSAMSMKSLAPSDGTLYRPHMLPPWHARPGAGRLLMGHFSARYKSLAQLEEEARADIPRSRGRAAKERHMTF
ncbi:MAG: hypothetical protein MZV63_25585 [Marinilabiliales bacterium]|nr:hypothetical protein [Marinilabiliales bacterium]